MKKKFSFISLPINVSLLVLFNLSFVSNGYAQTSADSHQSKPLINLASEVKPETTVKKVADKVSEKAMSSDGHGNKETHKKPHKKTHWSYQGDERPAYWGDLADEYATCKTGKNQSPINLNHRGSVGTTGLSGFDVFYRDTTLKIQNNGHSVQVNYSNGSYILINQQRYDLLQFHFHTPSEHQLNGVNYPMEMHLVHKNAQGDLAVIGILFQEGQTNHTLQRIISHAPKQKGKEKLYSNVKINPNLLFPMEKKFYKYSGSLTTPPCSQGVYWMVFKQPIEASALQLRKMLQIMGENNRPVQKHFARSILKSWQDGTDTSNTGMYEFY